MLLLWILALLSSHGWELGNAQAVPTLFQAPQPQTPNIMPISTGGENAGSSCPSQPTSQSDCSQVLCLFGQMRDNNNCLTCQCIDPCSGVRCPGGMRCLAQIEVCRNPPCDPLAMTHCVNMTTSVRPEPGTPDLCNRDAITTASTVVVPSVFQGCVLSRSFPQVQTPGAFGGSVSSSFFPLPPFPSPPTPNVNITSRVFRDDGQCRSGFIVGNCSDTHPAVTNTFSTFDECRRICEPVKEGVCPHTDQSSLQLQPCVDACLYDYSCPNRNEKCCPNRCGTGNVCVPSEPDRNQVPEGRMSCPIRPIASFRDRDDCDFINSCGEGCPGEQLCCAREDGCGVTCTDPVRLEYRYTCPAVVDVGGKCEEECTTDKDCEFFQRCCSNGCGKRCASRVLRLYDPANPAAVGLNEDRPGTCPLPVTGREPLCIVTCRYDGQCPGEEKCCSNGCGRHCSGSATFNGALEVKDERGPLSFPIIVDPVFLGGDASARPVQSAPAFGAALGGFAPGTLPQAGIPSFSGGPVPSPIPSFPTGGSFVGQPIPDLPGMSFLPGFPPMGVPDTTTGNTTTTTPQVNATTPPGPGVSMTLLPGVSLQPVTMIPGPPPTTTTTTTTPAPPPRPAARPAGMKPGACPAYFRTRGDRCARLCVEDRDCRGRGKCCSNGCGRFCVQPALRSYGYGDSRECRGSFCISLRLKGRR